MATYEEMKDRQRKLGPTGPDGPIGGPSDEPDYDAPALEPDSVVAPAPVVSQPAAAAPKTGYEKRLNEYRDKIYWPEFHKYVAQKIRGYYPSIPADADPAEIVSRYKSAFAQDMTDDDFYEKLKTTYGTAWKPSSEAPEPNLLENAQAILPQVPHMAAEMGKAALPFVAAQAGQAFSKIPGVGQAGMLANTGVKMLGQQLAGTSLEQTAQAMPEPNVEALRAKGYSPAQIENVLRGYAQVQSELYEEMGKIGQEGVTAGAEGIANAATFGFTGKKLADAVHKTLAGGPVKAGLGAAARSVAVGTAGHAATGAAVGAGYGASYGASERMAKAKEAGLGANDILTAGMSGAWEEGAPGAVLGGIVGGILGVPISGVSTAIAMNKTASVARKAQAAAHAEDALRLNLNKFTDEFRPHELPERFPEDLAAAAGNDAALAKNIVSGVWGPEVGQTEHGMQAASKLYDKIIAWRTARARLNGSTMLDLPQPVEQPAATMTPTLPFEGFQPTAQPGAPVGQVPPMQGMVQPTGPIPGEVLEPHGVAPRWMPQAEGTPTPAPNVPVMEGIQPVGAAVPAPPAPPLTLEGVQPPSSGVAPVPTGPSLGPVEQGGRPVLPAPEINPRLPEPVPQPAPPAPTPNDLNYVRNPGPGEGLAQKPSRAEAAIEEMSSLGSSTGTPDTRLVGDVEYRVSMTPDGDAIELNYIRNLGSEKGAGSTLINQLSEIADKRGLPIVVDASPIATKGGGKMPIKKLVAWYVKHGFKPIKNSSTSGNVVMRREPNLPKAKIQKVRAQLRSHVAKLTEADVLDILHDTE